MLDGGSRSGCIMYNESARTADHKQAEAKGDENVQRSELAVALKGSCVSS